jgi:murein DD-endopeptidase MepM/ murein hydrolase activator NlpD
MIGGRLAVSGLTLAALLGAATPATGQMTADWLPATPTEGSFIQIAVRPSAGLTPARITGQLAGQPLRFEPDSAGIWRSLAGIPLPSPTQLVVRLVFGYADGSSAEDSIRVLVAKGRYAVDRLTVAPRYSAPPDSALAARIAREQERAMAVSRASLDTPRLWQGAFARPRSTRVTSGYGRAREFNGQLQSRHLGVDLAGTVGAPVLAPNRGVVALVDETYYGGNVIYLDHGGGLVTAYLHLSAALVQPGDTVSRGQLIGRVGQTGRVTGPHLHWIARYGTLALNALSLEQLRLGRFGEPAQ